MWRANCACLSSLYSEKLEKAGTVDFKKHPARKVGTRSRQCGPKVPGRFAFPGARNPGICSISRFGNNFPAIFPEFSRDFPAELPQRPRNSHSLLEFSDLCLLFCLLVFFGHSSSCHQFCFPLSFCLWLSILGWSGCITHTCRVVSVLAHKVIHGARHVKRTCRSLLSIGCFLTVVNFLSLLLWLSFFPLILLMLLSFVLFSLLNLIVEALVVVFL